MPLLASLLAPSKCCGQPDLLVSPMVPALKGLDISGTFGSCAQSAARYSRSGRQRIKQPRPIQAWRFFRRQYEARPTACFTTKGRAICPTTTGPVYVLHAQSTPQRQAIVPPGCQRMRPSVRFTCAAPAWPVFAVIGGWQISSPPPYGPKTMQPGSWLIRMAKCPSAL